MKKPNPKHIAYQIRLNHIRRKHSKRPKKVKVSLIKNYYQLPTCFSLRHDTNRKPFLRSLDFLKKQKNAFLDFSHVNTLMADATIYFIQTLHKLQDIVLRGKSSKTPIVKAMLSKLKVHERLNLKEFTLSKNVPIIDRWYYCYGTDLTFDEKYDEIENVLSNHFSVDDRWIINDAISEAIANVVHHAYDIDEKYKYWVLFLSIEEEQISIIISDLGKTIPSTIKAKGFDNLKRLRLPNLCNLGKLGDKDYIEIATKYARTQTNKEHRGKGFENMQAIYEQVTGSKMFVYSRKGFLDKQPNKKPKTIEYSTAVNGTIIGWHIPLKNDEKNLKQVA